MNRSYPNPVRSRLLAAAPAFAILVAVLIAYLPATNAGYIWDDTRYVTENQTLRSLPGLVAIWTEPRANIQYYPLVFTSFWIEYQLWELRPFGYHLNNVLLHALAAVSFWRLLQRTGLRGAWVAAMLFALHPVHVASVAWVSERKNTLSGVLFLLTLMAWDRFIETRSSRRGCWYGATLGLFALALLAKTAVVPLAPLLLVWWWWRSRSAPPAIGMLQTDAPPDSFMRIGPAVVATLPFFALALASGLLHLWVESRNMQGSSGELYALQGRARLLVPAWALWFYLGKLVWPWPLMTLYPRWDVTLAPLWYGLYPLAAVALPLWLWRLRRRIGPGPLAAALGFGLMLAPALGWFAGAFFRYSYVADHFQYLASIGPLALAGALIQRTADRLRSPLRWMLPGVPLLLLALLTARQTTHYKDSVALWTHNLKHNTDSPVPADALGNALLREERLDEAAAAYRAALAIDPSLVTANHGLGEILRLTGKLDEAVRHYETVLGSDPEYYKSRLGLGLALGRLGRAPEAIAEFERILDTRPSDAQAHHYLGVTLARANRLAEATRHFEEAARIEPDSDAIRADLERARALLPAPPLVPTPNPQL